LNILEHLFSRLGFAFGGVLLATADILRIDGVRVIDLRKTKVRTWIFYIADPIR